MLVRENNTISLRYNFKINFYKKELFQRLIPFQSSLFVFLQTLFGRLVWNYKKLSRT